MATSSNDYFLGIDLGTSELKVLLITDGQTVIGSASARLTVQHPQPLWSEQSPEEWWTALERAMSELKANFPQAMSAVRAIGLSGQMHGAVVLGPKLEVLRPAILWNDGRSGQQCVDLSISIPDLAQITGNLAMPGFTAPKLLWIREHEPRCFEKIRKVLLPKDWLRLKLTGQAISDMSDAAGTLWLDTRKRQWSDVMLNACGLSTAHMPNLVEGSDSCARLLPSLCERFGLPMDVTIAGGAGDNAASAVGMGLISPGQGFVSLGTSGVVFACSNGFQPRPQQAVHAFCHALPNRWHQMSVMLSAASALSWATQRLRYADEEALVRDAATLTRQQCTQAPLFLPYLNGERSPVNNPWASASWQGLRAQHDTPAMAYAVLEGVGFGLRDGFMTLDGHDQFETLSLVGGGARSHWWTQLLADTLGVSLRIHDGAHTGAAKGAARLGMLAIGNSLEAVCQTPPILHQFDPDPDRLGLLTRRYHEFKQWGFALQALYREPA